MIDKINSMNLTEIIISLIILIFGYFISYKLVNRIKITLTINSILTLFLAIIYNSFLIKNIESIKSIFFKLNDNIFNNDNIIFLMKLFFIIVICLINYVLIKNKKIKKDLNTNSFDFILNILASLVIFSNSLNIIVFIVYVIVLFFYWNVNFSYNKTRIYNQEFDFHIHTSNSDGEYTTHEIVELLKKEHFKYFSITDHDSIKSIEEVQNENLDGMKYISGVEISTILDNKYKMHILGYDFTKDTTKVEKINEKVRKARIDRMYEMAKQLKEKYDIDISEKDVDNMLESIVCTIGKPHMAALIVRKGYAKNISDAIVKYIDELDIKTQYRIDFKEVVDAIHSAGGKVVWAHPRKVEDKYNIEFTDILDRMIDLGLDGIEVYNTLHTERDAKRYLRVCKEKNLLISGGSDYHGPHVKEKVKLGVILKEMPKKVIDINTITIFKRG